MPRGFDLRRAVCSYGYFILAPNRWDATTQAFHRPLSLADGSSVQVVVKQDDDGAVTVAAKRRLGSAERDEVRRQLGRMLRVDEDFSAFWRLHPQAKRQRFGRLLRSPTFFEDAVKTITGCNVSWPNTVRMNRLLCEHVGDPGTGAFPTAEQVAALTPAKLAELAKVGYRAERIVRLARDLVEGRLDGAWFEDPRRTSDEVYHGLLKIHGLGPYAAGNLSQLLGHYDRLAIDTETYRHFCGEHGIERPRDPKTLHDAIEKRYASYAPYQFLAYWFEIWRFYEAFIGRPGWRWKPDEGTRFTAAVFRSEAACASSPASSSATSRSTKRALKRFRRDAA